MGRSNGRKKLFIIAAAILAATGILAAARLLNATDARGFYFRAESRSFERYSKWINDRYTSFLKKQEPYMGGSFKRRMEVTADVEADGNPFGLKDAGSLFELMKKCKLVVDSKRQSDAGTTLSNVSLLVEKAPFLDAELFTKDRTLYFSVPVMLPDKYFSLKLDQIDEVYDKFSIPVKPRRLVAATDIAKTVKFDRAALEKSVKNLGSVFSGRLGENNVRFGEEREFSLSGRTVKGREVSVSLEPQEATALLRDLAAFIGTDEMLLQYTYGNFADLASMLDDAGLFRLFGYLDERGAVGLNEYEKDLLNTINEKKDLDGFRRLLTEALNSYSMKDGFNMVMVIDNSGNILDRRLDFDLTAPEGGKSYGIDIHTGSSSTEYEDCRNRFIKAAVSLPDDGGAAGTGNNGAPSGGVKSVELQVTPVFSKADGADTEGNVAISYAITAQNGVESGMDIALDISSLMDSATLKRNQIVKFQADMFGESGDGSVNGEVNRTVWENKKLNTLNSTASIRVQAHLPGFGIGDLSAEVKLAGEDKFGIEPFNLPELRQSNVTDLNTAADKDLDKIRTELLASFGAFYLQNKPIFDVILGKTGGNPPHFNGEMKAWFRDETFPFENGL